VDLSSFAQPVLEALPFPVLVVDADVRILAMNKGAERLVGQGADVVLRKRGGEVLHCVHHGDTPEGCGRGPSCADCVVRTSVNLAFQGNHLVHQRAKLEIRQGDAVREVFVLVTASPFSSGGRTYTAVVIEDLSELVSSGAILPICMHCKKVREDGQWFQMEQYLDQHLDLKVSHGICPACLQHRYAEFNDDVTSG
jgi:nitrogen fixation/metabolism regulation signal transduction histidine kinase